MQETFCGKLWATALKLRLFECLNGGQIAYQPHFQIKLKCRHFTHLDLTLYIQLLDFFYLSEKKRQHF